MFTFIPKHLSKLVCFERNKIFKILEYKLNGFKIVLVTIIPFVGIFILVYLKVLLWLKCKMK